jgi:uncharacterized protein YjbI with pentapeptide repeats
MNSNVIDNLFNLPILAILLFGITAGVLIAYKRTFKNVVKIIDVSNAPVGLEYWKHLLQIAAGFLVAFGILVSGRQLQLQSEQFIARQKYEARLGNNKQFYESAERLSKEELSNTEAALIAFRDLLNQDISYRRSVEIVLRAAIFEIATKGRAKSNGEHTEYIEVARQRVRLITDEYLLFFASRTGCNTSSNTRADLKTLNIARFDGYKVLARNADFGASILTDADFSQSDLECARFNDAQLNGANFNDANLSRGNLTRAQLANARLVGADLSYANLTGASLAGARLLGAKMRCANLRGADLSNAEVDINTLANADIGAATVLPDIISFDQIKEFRAQEGIPEQCSAGMPTN